MRFKKVIEGYGTSYNDLKSGTNKPTDFSKALDNAKEPIKATDKKGSQVDVISTAGEKDVVVQHTNKRKEIVKSKDLTVEDIALEYKLKKATSIKNKYRKLTNKLAKKHLKEQPAELFEINFNRKEIGKEAIDAPVKCGFEAETFFFNVSDGRDIEEMSIDDIEYEYGDLPEQAYEDYQDWLYSKGQEEYIDDLVVDKIQEVREDEEWLNDFIDSGDGPSSEAVERYKDNFEEEDPKEYENREEDGWEYINWVREYVEEEYEDEYQNWLDGAVREEYDLDDEATEAARDDYSMSDWINDNYNYMSDFLGDYGYDYGDAGGSIEGVADELHNWIKDSSEFPDYPESGDYGDTNTTTGWSVENDSSIDADEGTGAELISPVFDSPRAMLKEMKSLFDWSARNFGTNRSTGLHITMSWQGEKEVEPNKLKMALLLGDEYLLAEFGRLRNSYSKSQYQSVLKYAERMKRGDAKAFKDFEKMLSKGIDGGKMNSIHFKGEEDRTSGNNLIEFRIAGGSDYNEMFDKVFKATIRYATIMKAGYDEDAFKEEYVKAVFRLLRKSQEIDPKKLKDLEVVNHEVIDAAKSIVGKKDYFDVIKLLNSCVEYLQNYEKLSQPNADKEWKQEIKDYEKGTGSKFEIEEETIKGYIQPNSMAPSKRAAGELDKAQGHFGSALTLLARDIADGNNRAPVSAKSIAAFRKFAKELQLKNETIEKLAFSSMDNFNFDGTDKQKVARLKKGLNTLFRQDIVKEPEYLTPQNMDIIASKMWQFFMSKDSKDNVKRDKLVDLLVNLTPANNKVEVQDTLNELDHERTLNGFVAKLKGNGWNTRTSLLKTNGITSKDSAKDILKFLEPYKGYEHPTSPDHHVNIKSDDPYEEVAQMSMVQKLRHRLDHLNNLETDDADKYNKIKAQLLKVGEQLINTIGYDYEQVLQMRKEHGISISQWALVLGERDTERALDFIEKSKDDDNTYNFVTGYDDYIIRNSLSLLPYYFKGKQPGGQSEHYRTNADANKIIKTHFAGYKKFLNALDKIFTAEGFIDLKADISNKNRLDKRNKDFEKNTRDNAKAKLNIPEYSWMYIDKEFFDTITDETYDDRGAYLDNHIDHFNKNVNNTRVWVIPSSHWSDAEDATNGLELIDTFEKNKNYYHTWRKKGYKKILNRFTRLYGYSWSDLVFGDSIIKGDSDIYEKLKDIGIEITHQGDSRKGATGQDDLFPDEETENPISGEPLNRNSSDSWSNMEDDASQKRFDAFDWEQYPAKMKDIVAKVMKQKEQSGYDNNSSFKVALQDVLNKVLDGDVDIDPDDLGKPLDKLATAAGIDPLDGGSSNGIASATDWKNLADYLGIERGVNDQGAELLRVIYNRTDGNHEWRPAETDEDGKNVIGLKRWAAAVKQAEKYIKDNYNVSGGNYFRKNADGSDGDDVSSMYSNSDSDNTISTPPEKEFDSDYDKARANHTLFNNMMAMGMNDYVKRGDVNNLVNFLNNSGNTITMKTAVLQAIQQNKEGGGVPLDYQDALSLGSLRLQRSNESVFDRFDKLPLLEQLRIVSESKVLEGTRCWKGYKKKGTKKMFGKTVPNCVKNEGEVVPINKTEPKRVSYPPYFSPQEAQRAFDEWKDQAQVDQGDGVLIKDIDGKQYRIMTSYGNQAYEDGEVFLQGLTDPNYIELVNKKPYGHPDAAELLYYHSKDGTYVQNVQIDEGVKENFAKLKQALSIETGETKEMMDVYRRALKNQASSGEIDTANKQFKDLLKLLGITTFVAGTSMIPGTGPALFPIEKYLNTKGISILPNGFKDAFPQELPKSLHKVGDKVTLGDGAPYDVLKVDVNTGTVDVKDQSGKVWTKVKSTTFFKQVPENFADGKKKGKSRPGRVKKAGASCKGSVTDLKAKAKKYSGEKGKMYQWCANMKGGKKKANEELANKLKLTIKANAISESLMMTEVDRVKDINDILSVEFPVNNYKLQMKAFVALPVPEMLDAFKDLHARYGAKSDAREIVRHFAKSRMPKEQLTKINLGV